MRNARPALAVGLAITFVVLVPANRLGGACLTNVALMFGWMLALSPVRAIGRVLLARLCGLRLAYVGIGYGPRLVSLRLGRRYFDLHAVPRFINVGFATRATRALGLRWLVMLAGGLMTQLAVAALVVALLGSDAVELVLRRPIDRAPEPLAMLLWADVLTLLWRLIPTVAETRGGIVVTDGWSLWQFSKQIDHSDLAHTGVFWEYFAAERAHHHEYAEATLRAALERDPQSQFLRHTMATHHLRAGSVAEARPLLEALLEETRRRLGSISPEAIANDLAYSIAASETVSAEDLDRAADLSYWLVEGDPAPAWVHGTHGAVLVRRGEYKRAREHLEIALRWSTGREARAANRAWLALVHAALGRPDDAARHLTRARREDPTAFEVPLVERLIAAAHPAPGGQGSGTTSGDERTTAP